MSHQLQMTLRQIPILLLTIFPLFLTEIATAQTTSRSQSCETTLQTAPTESAETNPPNSNIITASTNTPTELTEPSLWWAKEQFDTFNGKLINHWCVYPNKRQIDLFVNRQYWTFYNYLDRYRFINQFGTVARNYGYNLHLFNQQRDFLATYICDFTTNPTQCDLDLDPIDDDGFQLSP